MPYKDPEKAKAASLAWRKNNPERVAERQAGYRKADLPKTAIRQKQWYADNPERYLYIAAKSRAKKKGLEFTILLEDVAIPAVCPVLGIPISRGTRGDHGYSPSLDRIDSSKGYVPGNVMVISWRANIVKSDAEAWEVQKVADYMFRMQRERPPRETAFLVERD